MSAIPTPRAPATTAPVPRPAIHPLQNGDRLTRDEFERRYHAAAPGIKAELIEGEVYIVSPVTEKYHGNQHFNVIGWLAAYAAATPGVIGGDNATLRLDLDNEPQPDAYLRVPKSLGGGSMLDDDGYVWGVPELIVEVAASSASYDLGKKLNAYRRNGVSEYAVWRVYDEAVDWFALRGGAYQPLTPGADGILRSDVYPGLWLDMGALIRGDVLAVLQVVQRGLATLEHAAFAAKLASAAAK